MPRMVWTDRLKLDLKEEGMRMDGKILLGVDRRYEFIIKWPPAVNRRANSVEAMCKKWELALIMNSNGIKIAESEIKQSGKPGMPGWYFHFKVQRAVVDELIRTSMSSDELVRTKAGARA